MVENKNFYLIGIGASAGGLEAIESFFSKIPSESGLAFVIIQHLSPDYESLMPEILSKRTMLKIQTVEDGMLVQPNNIYLLPKKKNMKIFHSKLYLTEKEAGSILNLPIDIFFHSLAEDFGERAVGVILSGTGSDGSRGIRAVKEAGGMIFVQDPDTAKFDGMPRSAISTGVVDFVLNSQTIAEKLVNFIQHPYVQDKEKGREIFLDGDDYLTRIILFLKEIFGLDFTFYKTSTIVRRLERRLSINQIENLNDYLSYLYASKNEQKTLYKELLIGVTKFFRDVDAFSIIEQKVIPMIFDRKNEKDDIRVWVAACSTGEEAYSLAILLKEYMLQNDIKRDVKIFATDVDKTAIEYASNGFYSASITADVSIERLDNFFTQYGDSYKVNDEIRELIVFATHNLIKDPPFNKIDLLTCRNLLIYFQIELQQKVLSLFHFSLNPDGFLFLGNSETVGDMIPYFEVYDQKWKLFLCKRGRKLAYHDFSQKQNLDIKLPQPSPSIKKNFTLQNKSHKTDFSNILNRKLLEDNVPETVVINDNFEIVNSFGDIKKYVDFPKVLEIHSNIKLNISEMVPENLKLTFNIAISKVLKQNEEIVYSNIQYHKTDNEVISMDLVFSPLYLPETGEHYALIYFVEKSREIKQTSVVQKEVESIDLLAQERIADLENELKQTKENLSATIEELETTNEELQSTNEELISANEELQSTNEELQSVNEELYTVNSEFQTKNHDLTVMNNDMENLLANSEMQIIFLDNQLKIRKFTPKISKIINVKDNDIGRPISDLTHILENVDLSNNGKLVITQQKALNEVVKVEEEWFQLKFLPYRAKDNSIDGVVITLVDISEYKRAEQTIKENETQYKQLLENIQDLVCEVDAYGRFIYTNSKYEEVLGYKPNELLRHESIDLIHPEDAGLAKNKFSRLMKKPTKSIDTWRFKHKNGSWKWFECVSSTYEKAFGELRTVVISRDITEKRKHEELYNLLFQSTSTNGFAYHEIITDDKGSPIDYRFLEVNDAFEIYTNRKKKEVVGKTVKEIWPDIEPFWIETYGKIAKSGQSKIFQSYSKILKKHYEVYAFSPKKGEFVTIFHSDE